MSLAFASAGEKSQKTAKAIVTVQQQAQAQPLPQKQNNQTLCWVETK